MSQHLVWLRTDLRLLDNPALFSAAESGHVTALFLLTPAQWEAHGIAAKKIAFILRSLDTISEQLAERGIEKNHFEQPLRRCSASGARGPPGHSSEPRLLERRDRYQ